MISPAYPWPRRLRRVALAVFWLELGTIFWAALLGGSFQDRLVMRLSITETALHVAAFAVLGITALALWRPFRIVLFLLVLLAASVEIFQFFVPSRSASLDDLAASAAGVAIAAGIVALGDAIRMRRSRRPGPLGNDG